MLYLVTHLIRTSVHRVNLAPILILELLHAYLVQLVHILASLVQRRQSPVSTVMRATSLQF